MPRGVKKRGNATKFTNVRHKRRYLKKKEDKKQLSRSTVKVIKDSWKTSKTTRENIVDMGLAFDPNEVVPIQQARRNIIDTVPMEGVDFEPPKIKKVKKGRPVDMKQANRVVSTLEKDAATSEEAQKAQDRKFKLFHRETELCVYMLAKHGEDFESMCRDPRNLWQYTPKQWAKKIRVYKDSPYYKVLETV
ncbi:unnamed protein product [Caenorhabditis auriculariae]|uniref:Nucleolar protein 16 n=1 Tax=Caenorhabditis auriculariae TaxID=2777116 RepID=A0A8S1HI66_9PELO|nr:unnamed protein product [Caenorhabditis auriculariae]